MDALATVVTLLKPQAIVAKIIHGGGRWAVRYGKFGHPSFALVLRGSCWLAAEGAPSTVLETGDFVLFTETPAFTLASDRKVKARQRDPAPSGRQVDEVFHGDAKAGPTATLLGGYFMFDSLNAPLLLDLLPKMMHIRSTDPAIGGMAPVVELIKCEATERRAGRSLVLTRLVEILLVEALRSVSPEFTATGLLAGLRDPQLAATLHAIHTRTSHPWTLATLAREAGLSRSAFAERFARVTGMTPLNYLLQWRLAVARDMLGARRMSVAETAFAVGYQSASGFSTAFSRETGQSPREFMEEHLHR